MRTRWNTPWRAAALGLTGWGLAAIVLVAIVPVANVQAASASGSAYVSNQSGDISVIDLATMTVTGKVDPYGKEPRGLGVTADGRWLVVANRTEGGISVIERSTGRLVRKVKIGANPEFVRVRGSMAFVSFEPSATGKPPGQGADHDDDDDAQAEPARIAVVDLAKGRVVRAIKGGPETEGIEFAADGKHILVTNEADHTVTVHAIATGTLVKTIDLSAYGKRPRGIKRSPDGKTYVATMEFGNSFVVIGADYTVQRQVATGEAPYGLSFDRSGQRLFVAAGRAQKLQVFSAADWSLQKDIPIGKRCWHFTFTPDDRQILVACGRSDEVVVIDAATLELTARVADKQLPWGIVTYPKAMGSLDQPE